jgi:tetratricopeptide (TPR) repeat protein
VSAPLEEPTANSELILGNEAFSFGLQEEAEQHFLRSLQIYETPIANYNLAIVFHVTDRPAQAIEFYRRALVLDPDYQPARENLRLLGATI